MNNEFNEKHFVWDPAFTYHDGTWYALCLTASRDRAWGDEQFWKLCHSMTLFRKERDRWEVCKEIQSPGGHRLCAGSLISVNDSLYASLAHTHIDCGNFRLGQQLVFLCLDDPEFHAIYNPEPPFSTTKRDNDGGLIYGCRDPYTFEYDSGFMHYVCSGGSRWGVPPEVILLESATPYDTWQSATRVVADPHWNGIKAFHEIERVSVIAIHDKWIMTAHCWHGWVTQKLRDMCFGMGEKVTDGTIWVFEADNPRGPFKLREDLPFLPGSSELGMYGTHIQPRLDEFDLVGMGWNMEGIYCDRRQFFLMDEETLDITMDRGTFGD